NSEWHSECSSLRSDVSSPGMNGHFWRSARDLRCVRHWSHRSDLLACVLSFFTGESKAVRPVSRVAPPTSCVRSRTKKGSSTSQALLGAFRINTDGHG